MAITNHFDKNASTAWHPGSMVKLMTAIITREWISDGELDDTVTIVASDTVNPLTNSNMGLKDGDVISYRDLLYGLMLPSGNDAGLALARLIGGMILVDEGGVDTDASANRTRFVSEMNTRAGDLDLTTAVFTDSYGIAAGNRMSPEDAAKLMFAYASDALLKTISGTTSRLITITGANSRTYTVNHTIDPSGPVPFPEFVCGKTGTVTTPGDPAETSGGCCAMLWESPLGVQRVSVVMGADPASERFTDLRRLIDYELARLGEL